MTAQNYSQLMNTNPTIENQGAAVSVGPDRLFGVPYLVDNLREWAAEFRANQHPVTLTLFRAIQALEKMDAAIALAKDLRENAPLNGLLGIIDAAHRATEQECTCGGNPADDPKCCPACKVYHRLEAAKAASMSNTKLTHD